MRYAFRMSAMANREALRQVCRTPALLAMELLWRWSFGLGVLGLLLAAWGRVRPLLVLDEAELRTLDSADPIALASHVFALFEPYTPLLLRVGFWLAAGAAVLWVVAATLGRTVITRALICNEVRLQSETAGREPVPSTPSPNADFVAPRWPAHAFLLAARVLMLLIPVIGYLSGVLLAALVGGVDDPLLTVPLLFAPVFASIVLWSLVNWVLSLAPLFVERDGLSTLDAIVAALSFARRHRAELASIAGWNAALRTAVSTALTLAAIFTVAAGGSVWLTVVLVAMETLAYLVLSDWLLVARLAAYARLVVAEAPSR